jgi:hypothetical protein
LDAKEEVMKYPVKAASGDAGEFFFAYKIASVLKWPCRLIDIDIGIDAQVEIINSDRTSTGRFVAFQIKATSAEEQKCRYVSERQLAYWCDLDLPVFVVLVDLSKDAMYLHRVSTDRKYPRTTEKGSVRIDFDIANDRFTAKSGVEIAAAAEEAALSHIRKHLNAVQDGVDEIRRAIASMDDFPDPYRLIEVMDERTVLNEELAQASALVNALRAGEDEFAATSAQLEEALQELRDYMEGWNMHRDWDDDGQITKFIEEAS